MAKASVVLSFHEVLIHSSDLALLDGPYWLNDTIISFYFEYLERVKFANASNILFVSPEVTQCIKMVQIDEIKTFLEPLGIHFKQYVFFALNDNDSPDVAGGSHWSLLVYSRPEKTFYHLDSSSGSNHSVAWEFASHLTTYVSGGESLNFVNKDCLQQSNGYDCGVHVIFNTERLADYAYRNAMGDPETEEQTTTTKNGTLKISLPTVLEPEENFSMPPNKSFVPSEPKLSLPTNLCNPTSPLRLSSPMSLPTSPTPFLKSSLQSSSSQLSSPARSQDAPNKPVLNSGSATGNPRNKCALQPGHSLMDWIRLGNSGKDLTGVGGRIRPVSPAELAAHNTQKDAWLAIRGRVYNITHYLPYHPGGPEELMRGAGIDATQLFDKVHPWVNYDSLLAKCLVGPLRHDLPDADELFDSSNPSPKSDRLREPSKAQELVRKSMENLANCITPVRKKISSKSEENVKGSPPSKIMQSLIQSSDLPVSISRRAAASPVKTLRKSSGDTPPSLRYDWIQTSTKLTISVYTGPLANPGGCARIHDGMLLIEVATDGWLRTIKLVPESKLQEPLQLRTFTESGKIEVVAQKVEAGVWKGCGETTLGVPTKVSSPRTVECRVVGVSIVSHDTKLLSVSPRAGPVVVPLGYHVCVHRRIAGSDLVRSYTPVGDGWGPSDMGVLKLAIKRYPQGTMSPELAELKTGDSITLSGPYGNFKLQKLKPVKTVYFIAAGTGITPMLGLLKFMLGRSNPRCERLHLLFFNKTEKDILFRDKFDEIASEDGRLSATHVLSEASAAWLGHKGRITSDLLAEVIGKIKCSDQCTHFAVVCGPTEFTHTSIELLKKVGMKDDCIHPFMG